MNNTKHYVRKKIFSLLKNSDNNLIEKINSFMPFTTFSPPIEDELIKENISGENGIQYTTKFIEKDERFEEDYRSFEEILGNGYFNPYKKYKLAEYYVDTKTIDELDCIFKYKTRVKSKKNIMLIGEKGSGKTATQNCWLNKSTKRLEDEKIFFVRCDGHKLYELWEENFDFISDHEKNEKSIISLHEYLDLQFFYVFAKCCFLEDRKFIKNILAMIKKENIQVNISKYPNKDEFYDEINLYKLISQYNRIIHDEEKASPEPGYSYLIDHVMTRSLVSAQRQKRRWLKMSHVLQSFFYDNGLFILKIVDGVDNVHINIKSPTPFYRYMTNQCCRWIRTMPHSNELKLLVLRERTKLDIKNNILLPTAPNYISPAEIHQSIPKVDSVWRKRHQYIYSSLSDNLFKNILSNILDLDETDVNDLYHNNVRNFLHNKLTLVAQLYYRKEQLKPNYCNFRNQAISLAPRNKLLNGRLYINTKQDWEGMNTDKGQCYFNIFYFDSDKYNINDINDWMGMCCTRIIQYLGEHNLIEEKKLLSDIYAIFGYPEEYISECVVNLRAFGLIDSIEHHEIGKINLCVSKKGKQIVVEIFSNPSVLYYIALDTPMPNVLVEEGYINSHDNKLNRRTHYPFCSLTTVTTFINFISIINKIENTKWLFARHNITDTGLKENTFAMPFYEKNIHIEFLKNANNQMRGSDDVDIDNIKHNYIDKIFNLSSNKPINQTA